MVWTRVRLLSLVRLGLVTELLLTAAQAQESRATLSGTITDPSGAALASVSVRLTNRDTGVDTTTETNHLGQYRFLFLNPDPYRLSAEAPGFRNLVRDAIQLTTNQAAT